MINEAYISIRDVCRYFGEVKAVDHVSLNIAEGEFFSLLGPSGCGKTTLLRMLAGFETPTSGEIYVDDAPMSTVPPNQRPTNMVFQSYAIFPHLDVKSNVAYGLRKEGLSKDELKRKVGEALDMVALDGFQDRKPTQLSGGQRQRVALARALIKRPKVLLLDEPLSALDKKLREQMQLELRSLQKSVGITFIFVTHDQEEALTMSDRVAVMFAGQVLQSASPRDLYERPNCMEVADFIGTMNFIDARVQGTSNASATLDTTGLGELTVDAEPFARTGGDIKVAIRPEKLFLSTTRPGGGISSVEGRIDKAAYLGDRSHYYVQIEGCEAPLAVSAQNADISETDRLESEQSIWVSWYDRSLILLPRSE